MAFKLIWSVILALTIFCQGVAYCAPLDPESDLTYLGAFRLPDEVSDNHHWDYAPGFALTYRDDGDPSGGSDGYPGSLLAVGKMIGKSKDRDISEFSIPKPVVSDSLDLLPKAHTLQPFGDITGGYFDNILGSAALPQLRGLLYMRNSATGDNGALFWSIWDAYNVANEDLPSQGYSKVLISNPDAQGVWRIKGYTSKIVSGYLFEIPEAWAAQYLSGKRIAVGVFREGGNFARGPALFAIAPYLYSSSAPPSNNELPTVPLIYYNKDHDNYPDVGGADFWGGGAWITIGEKQAVVFVGSKCIGSTCYGTEEHCGDRCESGKGYHCYPKVPQMVFYDVDDLQEVAEGTKAPWDVIPYYQLDLRTLIPWFAECTRPAGIAYDRQRGLLYISQPKADGAKPLIHVIKINDSSNGSVPGAPPYLEVVQ